MNEHGRFPWDYGVYGLIKRRKVIGSQFRISVVDTSLFAREIQLHVKGQRFCIISSCVDVVVRL